jgi:uncharacterized membrane protein YedE/YeeE
MDRAHAANRIWAFLLVGALLAVSIGLYSVNELSIYLSAYLWFGFVYGMSLQYGRFCFSSAFRDLFAVGAPRMVVGIMIATIVFALTAAVAASAGLSTFQPAPIGVHSIIAGAVFGVGMVFAGGCASSSFYKAGEGNLTSALVVVTMGFTQAFFVTAGGWFGRLAPASWRTSVAAKELPASVTSGGAWFDAYSAGHLWDRPIARVSDLFGWGWESAAGAYVANFLVGVVAPAAVLLLVVYVFWSRKPFLKRWAREKKQPAGWRADVAGFWAMLTSSRRTAAVGLVLGFAAGLHMMVMKGLRMKFGVSNAGELLAQSGHTAGLTVRGTVHDPGGWAVATHSAQWAGWTLDKLGWDVRHSVFFGLTDGDPSPLLNAAGWTSIALVAGAAVMALLNDEFKFKRPTVELAVMALFGGALMGVGARLGLGCNIGAFFARVANGDPSGWLFGVGMTGGAWLGVVFFKWWTERKMAKEMGGAADLQL